MIKEPIQDALFDLEELTRQAVAATPWNGRCPLGYTTDYYTPVELDAALDRWRAQYGDFGSYPMSHMWHRALCDPPLILEEHELNLYNADGRCDLHLYGVASPGRDEASHDHAANPLPGETMAQANCPTCRWHCVDRSARTVVEAWHDHAFPGWRELPVLPAKLTHNRGDKKADARVRDWVLTHYPIAWHVEGAPIITERGMHANGAVARRSPFGGYDLAPPTDRVIPQESPTQQPNSAGRTTMRKADQ